MASTFRSFRDKGPFCAFSRWARRFSRARDGATAVEFAMVALPFFALLFGIIELAMIFILSTTLDNATAAASRNIRTGQLQTGGGATAATFKTTICNGLGWLQSGCSSNLNVDVRTYANFNSVALSDPITNTKTFDNTALVFQPGSPGSIVVVRAYYTWTLFTPLLSMAVQKLSGGKTLVTSTVAFRNEPVQLMRAFWTRMAAERRGTAAVEFALIAPVLIALYFGLAEYCQAMMADRKVAHVASSLGDLVAQSDEISNADMTDLFTVGRTLLAPFPTSALKLRVTSVTVDANNVAKVDWSDGSGLTAYTKGTTVTLPKNAGDSTKPFVNPGETVIMSEAQYNYDSPVDQFIKNGINFNEVFYLRPRKSDTVARTS